MTASLFRIAALSRHNAILRWRDPGSFVSYLIIPMVVTLVLAPVYRRALAGGGTQIATGMLVIFSALALSIAGTAMLTERTWHTWERLRCTRATVAEILIGKTLPVYALLLLQQAILLGYGVVVIGVHPAGGLLPIAAAVMIWSGTLLAVGSALAAVVRSHGELNACCDVGALGLTTLGGAFMPVSMFPGWLQAVAPVSPGYWALSMMHAAIRGDGAVMLVPAAVLLAVAVAAGTFGLRRLGRGWGRDTLL